MFFWILWIEAHPKWLIRFFFNSHYNSQKGGKVILAVCSFQKCINRLRQLTNFYYLFVERLRQDERWWAQMLRLTLQNQRLFNENNASVHIIISWTQTHIINYPSTSSRFELHHRDRTLHTLSLVHPTSTSTSTTYSQTSSSGAAAVVSTSLSWESSNTSHMVKKSIWEPRWSS